MRLPPDRGGKLARPPADIVLSAAYHRYVLVLLLLFAAEWLLLGLAPYYRADWALENAPVFILLPVLVMSYRALPLSRVSYTLIFVFLCLHEIGAHYTYARVPYDNAWRAAFGVSLNDALGFERNHYDRAIHFSYGLLLAYPIRELFLRVAGVRGFWGYFLPLDLTLSSSMLFELIEWGAVMVVGGDLGAAYLGAQGDIWDAHKDMALAGLGALLSMLITASINLRVQRDFANEWARSLRVKRRRPLGENALRRMVRAWRR